MRRRLFGVLLLALTLSATQAQGFGTIEGMGQHSEHQRVTRAALSGTFGPRTLDELAGVRGRFGAIGTPDNPLKGLMFTSAAHCDNGDFLDVANYPRPQSDAYGTLESCRAWMRSWLDRAVADAAPLAYPNAVNTRLGCEFLLEERRAKCRVIADLGMALHAVQDFYSHSNWVDRPADGATGPDNPPGLGHSNRAAWIDFRRDAPFPAGLMSGCFQSPPESWFCNYDHTHRVKHAALNKDEGPIGPSGALGPGVTTRGAINGNFQRAVAAAIDDTRDKWAYLQERLIAVHGPAAGRSIACVIRSDDFRDCAPGADLRH